MCRGPSQEVPCPPQGPATDQALESVSCQEQAPSGLISSGGKRHFVGRLSDSICVSCGPVASICAGPGEPESWRRGDTGGGGGYRARENLETGLLLLPPLLIGGWGAFKVELHQ